MKYEILSKSALWTNLASLDSADGANSLSTLPLTAVVAHESEHAGFSCFRVVVAVNRFSQSGSRTPTTILKVINVQYIVKNTKYQKVWIFASRIGCWPISCKHRANDERTDFMQNVETFQMYSISDRKLLLFIRTKKARRLFCSAEISRSCIQRTRTYITHKNGRMAYPWIHCFSNDIHPSFECCHLQ